MRSVSSAACLRLISHNMFAVWFTRSLWRLCAFSSHTKSSTPTICTCCEATTSALASIGFMGFTMNVSRARTAPSLNVGLFLTNCAPRTLLRNGQYRGCLICCRRLALGAARHERDLGRCCCIACLAVAYLRRLVAGIFTDDPVFICAHCCGPQASGDIASSCGRRSQIALTACLSRRLSPTKFSAVTAASRPICKAWTKSHPSSARQMFLTQVFTPTEFCWRLNCLLLLCDRAWYARAREREMMQLSA